jgi:tRNA G18 (ribose-2'-O)-methylase SpoU
MSFIVGILNVYGCLNIGNIIRTALATGATKVVIFGRRHFDTRSSCGAHHHIEVERVICTINEDKVVVSELTELDYFLDENIIFKYIRENNILPIFVEQDPKSIKPSPSNIKIIMEKAKKIEKIPMLFFGNETFGIPKNIMDIREKLEDSYTLELKQTEKVRSFNVSNCASIICYKVYEYITE